MLLAAGDQPALFIRPESDSALIGYVADDVPLELAGSIEHGRVPVRVDGALRARGYVPEELLRLRVQRRGRVRGTPAYVGPGDRVRVLGSDISADRLRVQVTARLGGRELGTYEGSYPSAGLSARAPDAAAEAPDAGVLHQVPARLALDLYELPGGPRVARLAAQDEPYEVTVVNAQDGWLAVRAGSGPYLVGWTNAALVRSAEAVVGVSTGVSSSSSAGTASGTGDSASVPKRLVNEPGELRRVAAHSKVVFGEQVIGVFKTEGWARVLAHYPSGFVDVFAAADDGLAIRGLLRTIDLLQQAAAPSEPVTTPAAPAQTWLPAAPLEPRADPLPQAQPPAPLAPTPAPAAPTPAPAAAPPALVPEPAGAPAPAMAPR